MDNNDIIKKVPGGFPVEKISKEDKEKKIKNINDILDNLDELQGLLGLNEYVRHLSYWQERERELEKG